jgi:A circularly permuted ATPgrasp
MIDAAGRPRSHYRALYDRLAALTDEGLEERIRTANAFFVTQGIGFTVYGAEAGTDRIFPFDLIPRIVPDDEWSHVELGLTQRIRALNLFLGGLYGAQLILTEGVVPQELVFASRNLRREMIGVEPPGGVYAHVAGIDLIRDREGRYSCSGTTCGRRAASAACSRAGPEADLRIALRALRRARHRPVPTRAPRDAPVGGAARCARRPVDRPADAGRLQLRVLRALVPRTTDGHRAGREPRPRRPPQPSLQADDERPPAGRRRLPGIDDAFLDPLAFRPDSLLSVARRGRTRLPVYAEARAVSGWITRQTSASSTSGASSTW